MTGGNFEVSIDASLPTTSRLCEDRNYLTKRNYDRFDLKILKYPKQSCFIIIKQVVNMILQKKIISDMRTKHNFVFFYLKEEDLKDSARRSSPMALCKIMGLIKNDNAYTTM